MALRIIVGLTALVAIIQGLAGDPIAGGILTLALVVLGLVYGAIAIDAEDATAYLAVTIAVGAAAGANVLGPGSSRHARRSPRRHRRSGQHRSIRRRYNHTHQEDNQPAQGLTMTGG